MTNRSLILFSVTFFSFLIIVLGLDLFFTRLNGVEKSRVVDHELATQANLFVNTFQTMDTGLRYKSSQTIFNIVKANKFIINVYIYDNAKNILLSWKVNSSDTNELMKIDQNTFDHATKRTRLNADYSLVVFYRILTPDNIFGIILIFIVGMIVITIILLSQLTNAQNDNAITGSNSENEIVESKSIIPESEGENKSENIEVKENQIKDDSISSSPSEPKFLIIDKKTGLTHEKFLEFRLNKELERSAENAIDISIIIFKFINLDHEDTIEAAKLLLLEFSHEDLIFESGKNSFTVLLPQHDLDQGIARADLLIRKAENKFSRSKLPVTLIAGLSSRNGRLLEAQRFIKEAHVALSKANTREGRIVGFRPDPVRFRNFLRHHLV